MDSVQQKFVSAAKTATVMGIVFKALTEMEYNWFWLMQSKNQVTVSIQELQISHLFRSFTGYDIGKIEDCINDLAGSFGFKIEFLFEGEELHIHVAQVQPDREPPGGGDDGDDGPVVEHPEETFKDTPARFFVKSATGKP